MGILQSDKFSPFIFIGLGGSGAKVVNAIAGKLHRHPNWSRIQTLCHFVGIDTNKHDLNTQKLIPESNRFLISSFERSLEKFKKNADLFFVPPPRMSPSSSKF